MITATRARVTTLRSRLGINDRLPHRLLQLGAGITLFGTSVALMIRAGLGLSPWDTFHQGLTLHTGLQFGWVVIALSVAVLLLWIPLRQRPGVGTVANTFGVGLVVNAALAVLPAPSSLALRIAFLITGILMNGFASGLYIGAGLGPGPRDGLMTGLAQRGLSIRMARTSIELSVLAAGWALGGTVGVGTVLYAVGIGPLVHFFLPRLRMAPPTRLRETERQPGPARVAPRAGNAGSGCSGTSS